MRKNVKDDIMEATIKLIEEKGSNTEEITIREICDRVGIGAGLVNYHFQTKEKLIAQCVQRIISGVIRKTGDVSRSLPEMTPEEKLRRMAKYTCAFLEANENISRISILTDLTGVNPNDNTSQTLAAFFSLMRPVFPEDTDGQEARRRAYFMILTFQAAFLRSALLKEELGMDFHDKRQREELVDRIIDFYIRG